MWKMKGGALKARKPVAKSKRSSGNGNKGRAYITDNIGVKAAYLKERSIDECLNCTKARCNCCPKSEDEQEERRAAV